FGVSSGGLRCSVFIVALSVVHPPMKLATSMKVTGTAMDVVSWPRMGPPEFVGPKKRCDGMSRTATWRRLRDKGSPPRGRRKKGRNRGYEIHADDEPSREGPLPACQLAERGSLSTYPVHEIIRQETRGLR